MRVDSAAGGPAQAQGPVVDSEDRVGWSASLRGMFSAARSSPATSSHDFWAPPAPLGFPRPPLAPRIGWNFLSAGVGGAGSGPQWPFPSARGRAGRTCAGLTSGWLWSRDGPLDPHPRAQPPLYRESRARALSSDRADRRERHGQELTA